MILTRVATLALLLGLLAGALHAQDAKPDLESLWKTGSLWEVGDNRAKVQEARKAIIAAGAEGRKFALTKLGVTAGLEIRCLNAVFAGWGAEAFDDLVANIAHENSVARRNVAEILSALNDAKAAGPLLAQAEKEESLSPRLSQLAALAKWKIEDAVPLLVEISRSETERVRHRAAGLLGEYETVTAVNRLIELLDDNVYYVRDGARDALAAGTPAARALCLARLREQLELSPAEQDLQRIRLLLPVISTLADAGVPALLQKALKHETGSVRGEAGGALVNWKLTAGLLDAEPDVDAALKQALDSEYDPYAKATLEKALARLDEAKK
ncbi:MAG: HEAT repeat domain-containing protein [Planctomycetes bacterium]|nr:HEAT repeat domain-containing protein [Planctomycetota bacterium]MCB9936535.1 HEAT repeat domain-containing protein [Planctomycetota bacterium]